MRDPYAFTPVVLPSGLRLFHHETDVPWVRTLLVFQCGIMHDPVGKEGCAHLLEHHLHGGTQGYPYAGLTGLRQWIGEQSFHLYSAGTGKQFMLFPGVCTATDADAWLRFLSAIVFQPSFSQDLEHDRTIVRMERIQNEESPHKKRIENERAKAFGFAEHRFHTATGLPSDEILRGITEEDVRGMHARHFQPANAILLSYGGCTDDEWRRQVEAVFQPIRTDWVPLDAFEPFPLRRPSPSEYRSQLKSGEKAGSLEVAYVWQLPRKIAGAESILARELLRAYLPEVLREDRRLVYSIGVISIISDFTETFAIAAVIEPQNEHAFRAETEKILRDPERLIQDLARTKASFQKDTLFSEYSTRAILDNALDALRTRGRIQTRAERLQEIDAVSPASLTTFLQDTLDLSWSYLEVFERP